MLRHTKYCSFQFYLHDKKDCITTGMPAFSHFEKLKKTLPIHHVTHDIALVLMEITMIDDLTFQITIIERSNDIIIYI